MMRSIASGSASVSVVVVPGGDSAGVQAATRATMVTMMKRDRLSVDLCMGVINIYCCGDLIEGILT